MICSAGFVYHSWLSFTCLPYKGLFFPNLINIITILVYDFTILFLPSHLIRADFPEPSPPTTNKFAPSSTMAIIAGQEDPEERKMPPLVYLKPWSRRSQATIVPWPLPLRVCLISRVVILVSHLTEPGNAHRQGIQTENKGTHPLQEEQMENKYLWKEAHNVDFDYWLGDRKITRFYNIPYGFSAWRWRSISLRVKNRPQIKAIYFYNLSKIKY